MSRNQCHDITLLPSVHLVEICDSGELEEPKQSALDGTESWSHTGELPESCFPAWHPVLRCLPRGEMGQVIGFHNPIKGML